MVSTLYYSTTSLMQILCLTTLNWIQYNPLYFDHLCIGLPETAAPLFLKLPKHTIQVKELSDASYQT